MEPGRELDKLVAEAMGWTNVDSKDYPALGLVYRGFSPGKNISELLPHYSVDWAAAGQAWEWLVKNHPEIFPWGDDIRLGELNTSPAVSCVDLDSEEERIIASGNTFPHAIALAVVEAAKAKGMLT